MGRRTLGIEISPSCIRGACLLKTWKGVVLEKSFSLEIPPDQEMEQTARLLGDTLKNEGISCPRTVLSLNMGQALFHTLTFPFSDVGKIREVAGFELEGQLPVSPAEYAWDVISLGSDRPGEHSVLAVLHPWDGITTWTGALQEMGLIVERVEVPGLALARWGLGLRFAASVPPVLVFADRTCTTLLWTQGRNLTTLRHLPEGTYTLSGDVHSGAPSSTPNALPDLAAAEWDNVPSFRQLVLEAERTFLAADTDQPLQSIAFFWAESTPESLDKAIAEKLSLEVYDFQADEDPSGLLGQCPSSHLAVAAAAWGQFTARHDFNLLRGSQDQETGPGLIRPHLRFLSLALAAVALCWGIAFGLDIYTQHSRLAALNDQVQSTFHELVPDAPSNVQPVQYPSVLNSRIRALNAGNGDADLPHVSVSRLLEIVSANISTDLDVQVTLFALDGVNVRMNGLAKDFRTVDAMKNALDRQEMIDEVAIVGANVDQGGGVSFSLRIRLAE